MVEQKRIVNIVGAIVTVVAVLGVGGYFAYQQFTVKNQSAKQAEEIAGWNTYKNYGQGYEFKYPKEWAVSYSTAESSVNVWSSEEKKKQSESSETKISVYPEFSVNYSDISSFKEFAKGLVGKDVNGVKDFVSTFPKYAKITIGGKEAYAVVSVANRVVYTVYIETDRGVYIMSAEHADSLKEQDDPANPKITADVAKIISTFKFTTSADQTAGWKTYTNSEYGFEFKYPQSLKMEIRKLSDYANKTLQIESALDFIDDNYPGQDSNPITFYISSDKSPRYFNEATPRKINNVFFKEIIVNRDSKAQIAYTHDFYLENGDKTLVWLNNNNDPKYNYDNILNEIVSTFKFTK